MNEKLHQAFSASLENGMLKAPHTRKLDPLRFKEGVVGRRPLAWAVHQARKIIKAFLEAGYNHYSGNESSAWLIVAFCNEQGLDFEYQLPQERLAGMTITLKGQ